MISRAGTENKTAIRFLLMNENPMINRDSLYFMVLEELYKKSAYFIFSRRYSCGEEMPVVDHAVSEIVERIFPVDLYIIGMVKEDGKSASNIAKNSTNFKCGANITDGYAAAIKGYDPEAYVMAWHPEELRNSVDYRLIDNFITSDNGINAELLGGIAEYLKKPLKGKSVDWNDVVESLKKKKDSDRN